jgi:cyclophilin family peptidyl-prolyl cis-trans isomerase
MKNFVIAVIGLILLVVFLIFFSPKQEDLLIKENKMNYIVTLETTKGEIQFETYAEDAPNTVKNFITLAEKGFYNGVIFHRVIDGFMIQGGDPTGTGMGGPGYVFDDEIDPDSLIYKEGYKKGIVAMANAGPNTQGSQFFIMVDNYPLPPAYTIFGKIITGQEIADLIARVEKNQNDKPIEDVVIKRVIIAEKEE